MPTVSVQVPATTSNIGSGFDCIGAAFTLYNQFTYQVAADSDSPLTIAVTGIEAPRVKTDDSNLAYQSFLRLYQHIGQTPPAVKMAIALGVPLSRGLGSSATAIVGGLVGANVLAGSPLSQAEIMELAITIEGHPDNVVPALLGGCRLAAVDHQQWAICDIPWHTEVVPIVAIPDFEVSTAEARRVLPSQYSRADAIFNVSHLGLLIRGLETGQGDWLRVAMDDRIHQPYRQSLIQGYEAVRSAALTAGAYGLVISGAGPTLLTLAHPTQAAAVEAAMTQAWTEQGVTVEVKALELNRQGAIVAEG
ncbi:MAG: homoserine kinase [Leptolyngbyaceae cyanobacterium SL_7_1]|nr:homoserine kinase [Leptolyngbyaceae cyanobacterium SL_7_1]